MKETDIQFIIFLFSVLFVGIIYIIIELQEIKKSIKKPKYIYKRNYEI